MFVHGSFFNQLLASKEVVYSQILEQAEKPSQGQTLKLICLEMFVTMEKVCQDRHLDANRCFLGLLESLVLAVRSILVLDHCGGLPVQIL